MIKKSIIFLVFLFLLFANPVKAQDLEVICNTSSCSPNTSPALFPSSEIWYPGKTLSKTIRVRNDSSSNTLAVSTKAQNPVSDPSLCQLDKQQLLLSIVRINSTPPNNVVWSGYLNDFYNAESVALANFSANSYDDFIYTVTMRYQAGNECQDRLTKFDLILNFTAEDIVNPTPTPTTSGGGGGGGGGGTGTGVSNPVCNDSPPTSAPSLISAVPGVNSVTLTWTPATDPVTYYLIAYGTSPGIYTFGNPNVGGKNTTTYTIYGLSGGTYYFVVRAGNGCSPGPFSNEMSAFIGGGFVPGIPAGYQANVQGVATRSAAISQPGTTKSIMGVQTSALCQCRWWWQILLGELIALIIYHKIVLNKTKKAKYRLLIVLIPILIYIIFLILNRCLVVNLFIIKSTNIFCRYFCLYDSLVLLIFSIVRKILMNSQNKED